jgi:hypothetical protein
MKIKIPILIMEALISPWILVTPGPHEVNSQLEKIYNHSREHRSSSGIRHNHASVEVLASLFQSRNIPPTYDWYCNWALTSNVAVKFVI